MSQRKFKAVWDKVKYEQDNEELIRKIETKDKKAENRRMRSIE